jgi:hypothetical protein
LAWSDIERLHIDAQNQGLILKTTLDHPGTKLLAQNVRVQFADASAEAARHAEMLREQRWIPWERFIGWFENAQFREALQTHAPKLLEDYDAQSNPLLRRRRQRRIFYFSLLGVGTILLVLLIAYACFKFAGVHAIDSQQVQGFAIKLVALALSLFIVLLVPLLGYYSIINIRAGVKEMRQQNFSAGITSLLMAAIQAGFATWIGVSMIAAAMK